MTAGTEVVCNDVVRKVEIEEKCIAGLDTSDLNEVGDAATVHDNVGDNGNSNVGGHGKDDTDDSSYVFVNGSLEVTAADPAEKGVVNVDAISPKSDSADEFVQFQKEELGIENGSISVDPLVLETNGIVNGSATVEDPDLKAVTDEVNLENGSTVDPLQQLETNGISHDVNGHLDQLTEEEGQDVKSTGEVDEANGITNVEAETDDTVSGITVDLESTLNPTESSQVTVFESESIKESESQETISDDTVSGITVDLESTLNQIESSQVSVFESESIKESESQETISQSLSTPDVINTTDESSPTANPVDNIDCEVMVNDQQESDTTLIDKAESQVTVDVSSKPSEDLESQVKTDESESSESQIQEPEGQATVDEPGKSSEDLECQVTADGTESETPIKEQESQVPVNGSDSIDSSVDNQESPVAVDVSESNGNHTEKIDSTATVMESDTKSEEHQDLSVVDSEVNVEAESNDVCNGTEPDSELVLSVDADALTNGKLEKFDGVVEMEETQISQTVADEDVPVVLDAKKEESEEKLEDQVEESSETPVEATEPVELETNIQDQIQEPQTVVIDNVQDDSNMEDNTAESTIEVEAPLETETTEPITHEDTVSQNEVISCVDETQEESAEHVEVLPSIDSVESQCKNDTDESTVVEEKVDTVAHVVTENGSAEGMDNETVIESVHVPDDEEKETKLEDAPVEDHSTSRIPEAYANPGTVIEFGSIGRHETVPNMPNGDVIAVPDVINGDNKPASVTESDNSDQIVDDKVSCEETEDINGIQTDEIPTSSVEGSVTDVPEVQNEEEPEVLKYNFLIRIPRFEDETFKDQIRSAQSQVEEKTRLRDAIRVEIQNKRARLRTINDAFNAAKQEENAAKKLVKLKRQEIDSVQFIINRLKNAESVLQIDLRIYNMEHMIQHETLNLKDEKQFIREIKQLKTLRDQLAANMGSQDEVKQAMEQKDETEERMRTLRKELDGLKTEVSKYEAATTLVGKKYDELSKRERELQVQFKAADDVRQKAYAHLNSLKKQAYDKNKNFRLYKEDVMAARDFASRGDKDSLHRLCANQVESFMEQWNNNDEFRNDYVSRCTMNATRRQKYLDGNSLAPDDVAHSLPTEKVNGNLVSIPTEVKSVTTIPPVTQESVVSFPELKQTVKSIEKVTVTPQKNQTLKTKDVSDTSADIKKAEEEIRVRKEEMELAKKAEELRKQEIEAKQKEQRRMEEKAKATEALERKKRIAEKAQLRAELRARKEAEQKEKEREKRMRKKEKKKAGGDGSVNGDDSESSNEATTKDEIINSNSNSNSLIKKRSQKPPAHFFSKQLKPKPVPPPAAIRNRKKWHQWVKLGLAGLVVLALFLLGNTGFFLDIKVRKPNGNPNGKPNGI